MRSQSKTDPKRRRRFRVILLSALIVLCLWPVIAWIAAKALIKTAPLQKADVIVVLSGSATYIERTRRAAELYREGRGLKILLTSDGQRSGWSQVKKENPLFVELAREELLRLGVPDHSIQTVQPHVVDTYNEAVTVREYASAHGIHSILFVTSAYHTRRALWTLSRTFQGSGIEVGLDAAPPGLQTPTPATWWWHRLGWRAVALEYPKLIYYYWKYK